MVEDELHDFEQVVPENVEVRLPDRWEMCVVDRFGLASPVLRQGNQLHSLHLAGDALEALRFAGMRHDAKYGRNKIPGGFKGAVDSFDLLAFLVALRAFGKKSIFSGFLKSPWRVDMGMFT